MLILLVACTDTASFGIPPARCDEPPDGEVLIWYRRTDPTGTAERTTRMCAATDGVVVVETSVGDRLEVRLDPEDVDRLEAAIDLAADETFGTYEDPAPAGSTLHWVTANRRTARGYEELAPPNLAALFAEASRVLDRVTPRGGASSR